MAATFTVEDGSVVAGANSLTTVAFADQYHENFGDPAGWSGATQAAKEDSLRTATRYIESRWRGRFKGTAVDEDQSLSWPRYGVVDANGFQLENDAIPDRLQEAVAILALEDVGGTDLEPNLTDAGSIIRERSKAAVVETEVEYASPKPLYTKFTKVDRIMLEFLEGGPGSLLRA